MVRAPGKGPESAEPLHNKGPGDMWPRRGHSETRQVLMTLLEDLRLAGCTHCEGKSSGNLLAGTCFVVLPLNSCKDPHIWDSAVGKSPKQFPWKQGNLV